MKPRSKGKGFGWDPVFQVDATDDFEGKLTYAEMDPETKNKVSHRSKAVASFGKFCERGMKPSSLTEPG